MGDLDRFRLATHLRGQFRLAWKDVHGASHWARVRSIGLHLARANGADPLVVELFAWLHDSRRLNDFDDPEHGPRAAILAAELSGEFYDLSPRQLSLLQEACHHHSDGLLEGDLTVQTCWDADRLDLGRVGKRPDPSRLCTSTAREEVMRELAQARTDRWCRRY